MNLDDIKSKGNWLALAIFLIVGGFFVVLSFNHSTIDFILIGFGILIIIVAIYGYFKELNPIDEK